MLFLFRFCNFLNHVRLHFILIYQLPFRNSSMASESGERLSKARLERLTDGVFAIVMTILVLEITIPFILQQMFPLNYQKN